MPVPQNDDQFIQRRMVMAAILSAAVMGLYIYLVPRPEPPAQEPVTEVGADAESPPESPPDDEGPAVESAPELADAQASREQTVTVETDTLQVEFTNRGAAVTRWILKDFNDAAGEQLDLVHHAQTGDQDRPFELARIGGEPIAEVNEALFRVSSGPALRRAPTTVLFEYAKDGISVRKSFSFEREGHVVEVETEFSEGGRTQRHMVTWNGGFGDTAQAGNTTHSQTFYYVNGELERIGADDAEDGRIDHSGPFPFVGIADLFFTAAAIPEPGTEIRLETKSVEILPDGMEAGDEQLYVAAAIGGEPRNKLRLYVGPKSREALGEVEGVGSAFRLIVDFGFLSFIAEPLFAMLRWVYGNVVANWGWSIVIVTIFINTILFPLKYKSTKSMRKMQQIQPLVKQINNKYKGVSMKDPRKAKQNEELQALYKKHDANPIGGCLPILLQMPFFFAFYNLLTVAIEMRQAEWLWVTDLANPESIPVRILPLAMVATQFLSQSLTPTPTQDATQARLMKFLPLVFGFIFYQFQAGLVLYWLTTNCVGIGQQLILNRLPMEELKIESGPHRGGKRRKRGK